MKKRTTTIRVNGERWKVPRGFGQAYLREAFYQLGICAKNKAGAPGDIISRVAGSMRLVGYSPTTEAVAEWPLRKRVEAVIYCATEYARAGDNPVQRHPRPTWLTEQPWQGPWAGDGVFAGPSPTELRS